MNKVDYRPRGRCIQASTHLVVISRVDTDCIGNDDGSVHFHYISHRRHSYCDLPPHTASSLFSQSIQ